jgi:hypothetical protein
MMASGKDPVLPATSKLAITSAQKSLDVEDSLKCILRSGIYTLEPAHLFRRSTCFCFSHVGDCSRQYGGLINMSRAMSIQSQLEITHSPYKSSHQYHHGYLFFAPYILPCFVHRALCPTVHINSLISTDLRLACPFHFPSFSPLYVSRCAIHSHLELRRCT